MLAHRKHATNFMGKLIFNSFSLLLFCRCLFYSSLVFLFFIFVGGVLPLSSGELLPKYWKLNSKRLTIFYFLFPTCISYFREQLSISFVFKKALKMTQIFQQPNKPRRSSTPSNLNSYLNYIYCIRLPLWISFGELQHWPPSYLN